MGKKMESITKKATIIGVFLSMLVFLTACGKPEDVVKSYCASVKAFDFDRIDEYMANPSENSEDDGDIEKEMPDIWNYAKENAKKMTYTVTNTAVNGDKATVTVKFDYVDASGIMNAALADYVSKAWSMALSGNTDEDAMTAILIDCFNEKKANNQPGMTSATLDFECVKVDGKWKIDKVPKEMTSVGLGNIDKALTSFGGGDSADATDNSDASEKEWVWHDVKKGETVELATMKMTILSSEETNQIGDPDFFGVKADAGTKYVIIKLKVENTTKSTIEFDGDELLKDSKDREFRTDTDAAFSIDEPLFYTELSPNVPVTGNIVYKVPSDSTGYYIATGKKGTNDAYKLYAQ